MSNPGKVLRVASN